jgi:hypothetical protein
LEVSGPQLTESLEVELKNDGFQINNKTSSHSVRARKEVTNHVITLGGLTKARALLSVTQNALLIDLIHSGWTVTLE